MSLKRIPHRHQKIWRTKLFLLVLACSAAIGLARNVSAVKFWAAPVPATPQETIKEYCAACHTGTAAKAGINVEQLLTQTSVSESFQKWEKIALVVEQQTMPPKAMPQPSDAERTQIVNWIRASLSDYAKKHDGEPGNVTVRRLTSGEYSYAIKDLTGLDLNVGIDSSSDAVGGEGFTNFGDVQFMQDANLERYLSAAKQIADHAVIGTGPLEFFNDGGKTGFELSAVARIKEIYTANGIRTVSGEGGNPFGLEKYGKVFFVTWQYKHRAALGEANITLPALAAREGIAPRFAEHVWQVMNKPALGYPMSDIVTRWQKLPAPPADKNLTAIRTGCEDIQKFVTTWPSWLFARGDVAAGGAGDESPLEFNDRSLNVKSPHHFVYVRGGGRIAPPPGPAKIYLNVAPINPDDKTKPVIIWRNLTVAFRPILKRTVAKAGESVVATAEEQAFAAALKKGILPPGPRQKLRDLVTPEMAAQLKFGQSPDGTPIGPDDFASEGSVMFEVPMPAGEPMALNFQVDAEVGKNRDQVARIVVSDRPDGKTRGIPTRALVGDMSSSGYKAFRAGVMEYVAKLPPNTHSEPTPADKDPIPDPFDSTYNVPEHDEFDTKVKYVRDDKFIYENMLDAATRKRLDQAWNDLYTSFEYHDNYLDLLAKHFNYDLKGKGIAQMDKAAMAALPAAMRKFVAPLRATYETANAAQIAARPRHLTDCLEFASNAWRRPLSEAEKQSLRAFYDKALATEKDHRQAIRALIARILVAPQFLYRVEGEASAEFGMRNAELRNASEQTQSAQILKTSYNQDSTLRTPHSAFAPLSNWEMASRLSFFLWASIPDAELKRAATAGELNTDAGIQKQVKRMLADPKARRMATEFFGQWLGFYHFDQHKGVDTSRYTEFTDDVKEAMYDEAISFFEYIIRKDRPIREILSADYTFLNKDLAKFYGVTKEVKATDQVEMFSGANEFHRGGALRLGAILTATSAPLRTSPVKRGDWILRRILGTPVPPPPADAGSLPADDKMFGGLSLKKKLEQHKRNATCANCHFRIDPLGFSLEHFDSTGRWRAKYADGNSIEDSDILPDKSEIAGVDGLLKYLQKKDGQVRKNLSYKLVGYAFGRTVLASDQLLIEKMVSAGNEATFAQLATEIATSKQFRQRARREEKPTTQPNSGTKIALNTATKMQGNKQ